MNFKEQKLILAPVCKWSSFLASQFKTKKLSDFLLQVTLERLWPSFWRCYRIVIYKFDEFDELRRTWKWSVNFTCPAENECQHLATFQLTKTLMALYKTHWCIIYIFWRENSKFCWSSERSERGDNSLLWIKSPFATLW